MKKIKINKTKTIDLPDSWEDLNFKQKIFSFEILTRVLSGDLKSQPHTALLCLLIEYTGYKPSQTYLSQLILYLLFWVKLAWVSIHNVPFLYRHGWTEYTNLLRLWKSIYRPDPEKERKQREIINFNLLRLAEQIQFIFKIDQSEHQIIPQYDFKTNPFPYLKIGRNKYYGKKFELDITAKTNITAREFVDSFDLLVAMNQVGIAEKQECINQLCAILYPKYKDYQQNQVCGHYKSMRQVKEILKFAIVYWFTGIVKFYMEHPVYSLLFKQSKTEGDEDKVRLGNEIILMLQKEGYGLPDTMNLNDYFDAQIKHLKDVISKALAEGATAFKIAQKTGLDLSTINKLS